MKFFGQEIKHPEKLDLHQFNDHAHHDIENLKQDIHSSWGKIAPTWPLKNLIAVNPLMGFDSLPFEQALVEAEKYFLQKEIPQQMLEVNRHSIKWLQAFYDQGQSSIAMPLRHLGLLHSTLMLLKHDRSLVQRGSWQQAWLEALPESAEEIIQSCLSFLNIEKDDYALMMTLMLTTLPGWSAYTKYRCEWADAADQQQHVVSESEYLAFRLLLTCLIWPDAQDLLIWHHTISPNQTNQDKFLDGLHKSEQQYQHRLLNQLSKQKPPVDMHRPSAQWIFCIDVRSEPFRRALESTGDYQTLGFAGFFGLPISVRDQITDDNYASCPVLLKPQFEIQQSPCCDHEHHQRGHLRMQGLKRIYQSLKYNFTTPFNLVETLGLATGLWMGLKSLVPNLALKLKSTASQTIRTNFVNDIDISGIPLEQQINQSANALKMMGLCKNFAPLVIFCGHGSATQNNAYATALDCGACGGRHGGTNAQVLAKMLNQSSVRNALAEMNIIIPDDTVFLAAQHNTTTDEVEIFSEETSDHFAHNLEKIKNDLVQARHKNSAWRLAQLYPQKSDAQPALTTQHHAQDWAQVRPEWGLSKNASFIIGPRWLTQQVDLEGRSFLHSYEWNEDKEASSLTTILTAPMIVTHWINSQYFFSTLDNIAFGGGSKISKNISGKIGIMQGNASDLMHGLPLQSVFKNDDEPYHECLRLSVMVYAPHEMIKSVIDQHSNLQKLFANGWIHLFCLDPVSKQQYQLSQELVWTPLN